MSFQGSSLRILNFCSGLRKWKASLLPRSSSSLRSSAESLIGMNNVLLPRNSSRSSSPNFDAESPLRLSPPSTRPSTTYSTLLSLPPPRPPLTPSRPVSWCRTMLLASWPPVGCLVRMTTGGGGGGPEMPPLLSSMILLRAGDGDRDERLAREAADECMPTAGRPAGCARVNSVCTRTARRSTDSWLVVLIRDVR